MPQLFAGTTTSFIEAVEGNLLTKRLQDAFFSHYGWNVGDAEVRSWRNSLRALAIAIRHAHLDDHGIAIEFQIPLTSKRIDALITGTHPDAADPQAVLVELKQWDDAAPSHVPECVGVRYAGVIRDRLHPSAQVGQYRQYLEDTHTAFHNSHVGLRACAYLHDFVHDPGSELLASRHAGLLAAYPLFAGDRLDELVDFLRDRLGGGGGVPVLQTIDAGRYRPHKKLLAHTAAMIAGQPQYTLLDEQKVVFNSIIAKVEECVATGTRAAFVVRGGPGTGKSVLALNLMGELLKAGRIVEHATGSAAFTQTLRKILGSRAAAQFRYFNSYLDAEADALDVLICDEAHRMRTHSWNRFTKKNASDPDRMQIDDLLDVARVGVFFIDDLQTVRKGEIGNSRSIEEAAAERDVEVHEFELEAQFRCGGSDAFVQWVENTLEIRRTANPLWSGDDQFSLRIVDSVEELDALVRAQDGGTQTARLVAGYCWPWSDPVDGQLPADVEIGDWAMPWNARPDAGRLAPGIPKSHLWASEPGGVDQVGCIYTAQGFEFDHVGVIWGPDLVYRPREGWVGRREHSKDGGLKRGVDDQRFTELVKNTYRVLLSRGLRSCAIYFTDGPTRDFVESRLDRVALEVAAESRLGREGYDSD